ncbi:MAG: hypothetical protein EXR79_05445 [Myxococcales bacterium]|nr:hypothetical protein [Myxococcales bacterium]
MFLSVPTEIWRARSTAALLASSLMVAAVAPASAAEIGQPDVTGPRFNVDGQGILHVDAARQQDVGVASLGTGLSWAWQPLVVATDARVLRALVGWRLQGDVGASVRLLGSLTLAAHVPVGVLQEGSLPSLHGPQSGPVRAWGVGDAVLTPKYVLAVDDGAGWGFGVTCPVSLPTGDPRAYLGRPAPAVAPTAIASTALGPWRIAANVGVRLQGTTTSFNVTDGPVFRWAVAGSLNPSIARRSWSARWAPQGWWLDAALAHESPLRAPFQVAADQRAEASFAVTTPIGEDFFLTLGSGIGVWPGWGTPAFRPMAVLRWAEASRIQTHRAPVAAPSPTQPAPSDPDGDRLTGPADLCPTVAEDFDAFEDADGCPDEDDDGDGLPDTADQCKDAPEDLDGHADQDGCPDEDNDGDTLVDVADLCPNAAEDMDGRADGDGCPDVDDDGDGILDTADQCPTVAENFNGLDDQDGCPEQRLVVVNEKQGLLEIRQAVHFATAAATVLPKSMQLLDEVAALLREHPEIVRVEVAGHTDERGTDQANDQLSQRRADAVVRQLERRRVEPGRLHAVGYGKRQPVDAAGAVGAARARNRRVEFRFAGVVERGAMPQPK